MSRDRTVDEVYPVNLHWMRIVNRNAFYNLNLHIIHILQVSVNVINLFIPKDKGMTKQKSEREETRKSYRNVTVDEKTIKFTVM